MSEFQSYDISKKEMDKKQHELNPEDTRARDDLFGWRANAYNQLQDTGRLKGSMGVYPMATQLSSSDFKLRGTEVISEEE